MTKEKNFTSPVLPAQSFIGDFAGAISVPTNWISDRGATLRAEPSGFVGNAGQWLKDVVAKLETTS